MGAQAKSPDEFKFAMESTISKDLQLEQSRLAAGQEIRRI
jgi:hypothetical protein